MVPTIRKPFGKPFPRSDCIVFKKEDRNHNDGQRKEVVSARGGKQKAKAAVLFWYNWTLF